MNLQPLLSVAALSFATIAPTAALASNQGGPPAPTAETLIELHLEASGGRERLASTDTLHATGKVSMPDQGLQGRVEMWQRSDGSSRLTLEVPGLGTVEEGTTNGVAWESSLMGPRLKQGPEKRFALRNGAISPLLDWRERYASADVTGTQAVGDRQAYRLELLAPDGTREIHLIDRRNHEPLGSEYTLDTPMGRVTFETRVLETERVDGVLVPARVEQRASGMRMVLELESVSLDVAVPQGTFTPPEAIQRLIESDGS